MSNGVVVAAMAFVLTATVAYGCSDDDRNVCAICREDLHACPTVTTTCKHAFHSHCLQAWFAHLSSTGDPHHRCPLCHRVLQYVRPQRPRPAPGISDRLLRLFCRSADAVILTLLGHGQDDVNTWRPVRHRQPRFNYPQTVAHPRWCVPRRMLDDPQYRYIIWYHPL